ncbi:hypothetical protein V8G54_034045 [Vigna mungo]|uniref:Uncharacterized protein n=1 Tax=Vigna mungo TaxID=3915 RepID=A0AAQ3MPQ8_VIGMU
MLPDFLWTKPEGCTDELPLYELLRYDCRSLRSNFRATKTLQVMVASALVCWPVWNLREKNQPELVASLSTTTLRTFMFVGVEESDDEDIMEWPALTTCTVVSQSIVLPTSSAS